MRNAHRVLRACGNLIVCALALCAEAHAGAAAPAPIEWKPIVEVAMGGGTRGPWRQNESNFDYVDDPSVALDAGGAAHVVWVDQRRKDVLYQVYERDGRARHEQPLNVSRTPRVFSWLPRIVLSPTQRDIYVLWQEIVFSGGSHGGDILFARSEAGGASFGTPINLSRSSGGDGKGRITRDVWHNGSLDLAISRSGALYAAWTEYAGALWFSRSDDGGRRFSRPLQVAPASTSAPARAPTLAAGDGDTVQLAWTVGEDRAADIRIATSTNAGRSFSAPRIVARSDGYSDAPKLAIDGRGTVHLVYAESAGGPFDRYHVRHVRSPHGARSFEQARTISKPLPQHTRSGGFPALAVDGRDTLHVLWELFPGARSRPRGLGYASSRDAGATFSRPVVVPGSVDAPGAFNGSQQGLLMRKLSVNDAGSIAIVNSSLEDGVKSRVWLMRGVPQGGSAGPSITRPRAQHLQSRAHPPQVLGRRP